MEDHKKDSLLSSSSPSPLQTYPLDDSTSSSYSNTFFAFLGEWMILFITCALFLFFIPFTPALTLHATSSSVLSARVENRLTANLGLSFLIDKTNPFGGSINYASFNASLFKHQQKISTFSPKQEATTTTLEAEFLNVSVTLDEWDNHHHHHHYHDGALSCGFVDLDLWFSVDSWRDKLQGHCGDVKFELCSSSSSDATNVVAPSFLVSCDVHSELAHKVRLGVLLLLILLLVGAAPVPILVEHFFCFESLIKAS